MPAKTPDCECSYIYSKGHDWLLDIESRGMAGVIDLWTEIEAWEPDNEGKLDLLPLELPSFAAQHNWKDATNVYFFFSNLAKEYEHNSKRKKCSRTSRCYYSDHPLHDRLIFLEDGLDAVNLAFDLIDLDEGMTVEDLAHFVACHRWDDPHAVKTLIERLEHLENLQKRAAPVPA